MPGWKIFVHLLPALLSWWLLAAHFLRWGQLVIAAVCVVAPLFFFWRSTWVRIVTQIAMFVGAGLWLLTASNIAIQRMQGGQPWIRMAMILGAVALFNVFAAGLLQRKAMRGWYAASGEDGETPATP